MTNPSPISGLAERRERYMRAYYHEFTPTGCDPVDAILEAVAMAGKAYHSTELWDEAEHLGAEGYWTLIQSRANEAATTLASPLPVAAQGGVTRPKRVQAAFDVWRERDETGPNATALFEYIESLEASITKTAAPLGVDEWDLLKAARDWIADNIREGDIAGCTLLGKLSNLAPIPAPDAQENAGLVAARQIASEQCASVTNVRIPDGGPLVTLTPAPDAQAVAVKEDKP